MRLGGGAKPLLLSAASLSFQTPRARGPARSRGDALLAGPADGADQLAQAFEGGLPVFLRGAMLLCLEHQHTLARHTAIVQGQRTLLVELRQRRGTDVEAQMYGR